ncbi:hypothetical protein C0992_011564 [Termitomyces sp. T32_za158]|nr:hypothetical protein C0992_011564 [Termitomyces sp. T32_za158]
MDRPLVASASSVLAVRIPPETWSQRQHRLLAELAATDPPSSPDTPQLLGALPRRQSRTPVLTYTHTTPPTAPATRPPPAVATGHSPAAKTTPSPSTPAPAARELTTLMLNPLAARPATHTTAPPELTDTEAATAYQDYTPTHLPPTQRLYPYHTATGALVSTLVQPTLVGRSLRAISSSPTPLPTPSRNLQDPSTGSLQPATATTTLLYQDLFKGDLSPAPSSVLPTPPTSTTLPLPLPSSTSTAASQQTNLLQHQPTMEQAETPRMPTRGHFSAPKWDETKLRELTQYFRELEYLFHDCNITDHTQMKEYTSRYVSYDTTETWTGITEFNMQIPGNQESATPYTINDLHQLAQDTFEDGIYTIGALSTYYQDFQRVARWLLQNGKLYRNEERHLFQQGIPTSLWTKIACRLEIAKPDHYPLEPYDVEDVLEAGKWTLKSTNTSITVCALPASQLVGNGTPGILPLLTALIAALLTPTTPSNYVKQEDLDKAISTALSSAMTHLESLMNNSITTNWQRNIRAVTITVKTCPTTISATSAESLDMPKQVPKGYKPMANAAAPATAPAPATPSTTPSVPVPVPAPNTATPTASTNQPAPAQTPLHPYSGIPNRYAPPAQKNFAAPNKCQEGPYQPTAPVYDIEKSNHVFSRIMKSAVTLSVEELCSIAPDICNQMKTAVTSKRTMQATIQDADDIDNALPGFA